MPVESHAETGDERKAVAALFPHIVGNVQIAAGSGPLRRATCTEAPVTVRDPQSRANAGGFGMLWLTALTFSLMKEVKAAGAGARVFVLSIIFVFLIQKHAWSRKPYCECPTL